MSQPTPYNRIFSFSNLQSQNPTAPPPGNSIDIEFNSVKATLDQVLANLALIQNDDTSVKNASVGPNQLSPALTLGFTAPTTWVTLTNYTASPASTVFNGSSIYTCLISHTAGVFATDLAAGKWQLILNLAAIPITAASQMSVTPSGTLTTDAQTSLQALDSGKASTGHSHTSAAITDSTAAGRNMLTAATVAAQQALLGLGSLAFLNTIPVTAITAQLAFTGKITPAALSSNTNDWNPTSWATSAVVEVSATLPINITGFVATTDGDIKILDNTGANTITLTSQDASSAAANRLAGPAPVLMLPGEVSTLKYDGAASRWRLMSTTSLSLGAPLIGASGLKITNGGTPNTQVVVTANQVVMQDSSGRAISRNNVSVTIDLTTGTSTSAANGMDGEARGTSNWLYIWVIDNGVAPAGLVSLASGTGLTPTLPTGYTYKFRVGAMRVDGSGNLLRTIQLGPEAQYQVQAAGALPVITSSFSTYWTAQSVVNFVPATATKISVSAEVVTVLPSNLAGNAGAGVAPNPNYGTPNTSGRPPVTSLFSVIANGTYPSTTGVSSSLTTMTLESTNIYTGSAVTGSASLTAVLSAVGWRDNVNAS
jgi:hypothetical protein